MWHLQASLSERILKRSAREGDTGSAATSVTRKRRKDMRISVDKKQTESNVATSILSCLCAPVTRGSRSGESQRGAGKAGSVPYGLKKTRVHLPCSPLIQLSQG